MMKRYLVLGMLLGMQVPVRAEHNKGDYKTNDWKLFLAVQQESDPVSKYNILDFSKWLEVSNVSREQSKWICEYALRLERIMRDKQALPSIRQEARLKANYMMHNARKFYIYYNGKSKIKWNFYCAISCFTVPLTECQVYTTERFEKEFEQDCAVQLKPLRELQHVERAERDVAMQQKNLERLAKANEHLAAILAQRKIEEQRKQELLVQLQQPQAVNIQKPVEMSVMKKELVEVTVTT